MHNLRICVENILYKAIAVTASSSSGSMLPANLLSAFKAETWRSTSVSSEQFVTVDFANAVNCNMLALLFTNFTENATVKAYFYTNVGDASPVYTSSVTPVQYSKIVDNPGINSYAYGGGNSAVIYIPEITCKRIKIGISDNTNSMGYVEFGNFFLGKYWEPINNCDYDPVVTFKSDSKHFRNKASDLQVEQGVRWRELGFTLSQMDDADKNNLLRLIRINGMDKPFFISIDPESESSQSEQLYQMVGVLSQESSVLIGQGFEQYITSLKVEEA